jgi:long-subunit fatty acid transport protein
MKRTLINLAVVGTILGAGMAQAGGFDRSGQDTSIILKEGSLLEITSVSVNPNVTGTYTGAASSGEVSPNFSFTTFGFRTNVSENMSIAIIQDTPFGGDVDWTAGTYVGTKAKVESSATTLLASYDLDNVTIYGGLKNQSLSASASVPLAAVYTITSTADSSLGYVLGAAIEKPEIAMRVALTYHSKINHEVAIVENHAYTTATSSTLSTTTPESVNLDFQTGIAENTLLFGTVRQVKWTQMELIPAVYKASPIGKDLKTFSSDVTTYSLGLGRKFTDQWSGAVTYGTEAAEGVVGGPLGPTDGYNKMGLGVTYTGEQATVTLGVQKINNGDISIAGIEMANNTTLVTAVKIGYKF